MSEAGPGTAALPISDALWTSTDRFLEMANLVATAREAPVGRTPKVAVWRKNKARLYRYTGPAPAWRRTPVFLCLPLINRAYILDLRPGASFVEHLLADGYDVFLLDWGVWAAEDRGVDITTLVIRYLPRAVRAAAGIAGAEVTLLGYCIGGVLATCYLALHPRDPVKQLVLFTTPIDFADAGKLGRWTAKGVFPIERLAEVYDTVPGELIGAGAKLLNGPLADLQTFVQLAERMTQPGFDPVAWQSMYRWINEGTPFPAAAYVQWITEFYQDDRLARGTLRMDGRAVRLSAIRAPLLNVAAAADTIAPRPTTSAILAKVSSADREEIVVPGGHVGIVVGRAAKQGLWPRVSDWLARHDGAP
ncbi:MAG: alpha/beta fold hydrolase, partial [Candidatus Limnocylindria bacterium]